MHSSLIAAMLLLSGCLLAAETPVARIRSAEPFTIDGVQIATPGVTSWPLVVGDEVASAPTSSIVVTFLDGSSMKLGPTSRARIAGSERRPKLILLSGSLDFRLVPNSAVLVTNLDIERANATRGDPPPPGLFTRRAPSFPEPKFVLPAKPSPTGVTGALIQLPLLSRH